MLVFAHPEVWSHSGACWLPEPVTARPTEFAIPGWRRASRASQAAVRSSRAAGPGGGGLPPPLSPSSLCQEKICTTGACTSGWAAGGGDRGVHRSHGHYSHWSDQVTNGPHFPGNWKKANPSSLHGPQCAECECCRLLQTQLAQLARQGRQQY